MKQVQHIKQVLGLSIGDHIRLGQLGGLLGSGIIQDLQADQVVIGDISLKDQPPAKLPLTLVLALPRPKVLRRLVMDMTALGVAHLVFINSYRTEKSYWASPLLEHLDEFVQEGLQQGVDCVAPKITLAKRFKPFVQDHLPALMGGDTAVVAHPYALTSFGEYVGDFGLPKLLVVGAEGGFIPYEIELLGSVGVAAVHLGPRIMRTEAAVNALLGRWLP